MSLRQESEIACPKCSNRQKFQTWESINTSANPDLKQKLLDGELTAFICKKCGFQSLVEYDTLYHDMKNQRAFWLKYPEQNKVSEIDNIAKDFFSEFSEKYTTRLITSYHELIEKISICDNGFNDFETELLKLVISMRDGIDLSKPMYFTHKEIPFLGSKKMVFLIFEGNDYIEMKYPIKNDLNEFKPVLEKLLIDQLLTNNKWPYINRDTILKLLENAGMMSKI
jgi:predicted nucleic-acid-binding Zn-ribbon protein